MKSHLSLLLLLSACGRIGVDILPEDLDASVGKKPGKMTIQDAGIGLATDGAVDAVVDTGGLATDATVDSMTDDSSLATDSAVDHGATLYGTWFVTLTRTTTSCQDTAQEYQDLWFFDESGLHSVDYDLQRTDVTYTGESVSARVEVVVMVVDGTLTGTHKLFALDMNRNVRCSVERSVRGERE